MRLLYLIPFLLIACSSNPTNSTEVEHSIQMEDTTPIAAPVIDPEQIRKDSLLSTYDTKAGVYLVTWTDLSYVTFEEEFVEDEQMKVAFPVFDEKIRALEGQIIEISGYIIPDTESKGNLHVLSALPFSSCFFCGGAGPETVMDLILSKEGQKFKTDQRIKFKGKLKLNDTDFYYLNYILEDAEIVK